MKNNQREISGENDDKEISLQNAAEKDKVILDYAEVVWLYRNSQSLTKRLKSLLAQTENIRD